MTPRSRYLLGFTLLALIVLAGSIFFRRSGTTPPKPADPVGSVLQDTHVNKDPSKDSPGPQQPDPNAGNTASGAGKPPGSGGTSASGVAGVVRRIKDWRARLEQTKASADQQAAIRELFKELGSADLAVVIPAIMEFLASGEDATLLSGIEIGPRGLEAWSSLRVALLDFMGEAMPPVAAEYARTVFDRSNSPDEWAISLRNTSRVVPPNDPYLTGKTLELLTRKNWADNPTNGYLQAYDLTVHTGDPRFIPILERGLRTGNQGVRQASTIALERLATTHPLAMLEALGRDTTLLAASPDLRAGFFARANVADPGQKALVESYLLRPDVSPAELDRFAALFPNRSAALSFNLVTQTRVPDFGEQANQDVIAQGVVSQWLQDARFARVKATLVATEQRLRSFVDQAGKAGLINSR